jgi:hypothetical protein
MAEIDSTRQGGTMHDLDRTRRALESGRWGVEGAEFEFGADGEGSEFEYDPEWEREAESDLAGDTVFGEVEEMELAAALLEVRTEEELDRFLGKMFRGIGRGIRKIARPIGRALGGALKGIARVALPAVGTIFGGPLGGKLGLAASRLFELELEGMDPQDQEFEVARRFVRLAGGAARQAAQSPAGRSPQDVARRALLQAARQHAPGLLRSAGGHGPSAGQHHGGGGGRSGVWVRRGRQIVLLGA